MQSLSSPLKKPQGIAVFVGPTRYEPVVLGIDVRGAVAGWVGSCSPCRRVLAFHLARAGLMTCGAVGRQLLIHTPVLTVCLMGRA